MESLAFLSTVTPLPLVFAFLAGILFLQRTWIFPFIRGHFLGTEKETAGDNRPVSLASTPSPSPSPSPSPQSVSKESEFPDSWWTGKNIWELERRSIFSKSWLYVAHLSRFRKPGDYQSITVAGYPIFLILGKDGKIRTFHNVCRHRAYTVTKRESGSSLVLGCRYHGWSYNASGALVKAPHFEDVRGFDKSQNGLFEIQTAISGCGLIFVNLKSGEDDFAESFDDLDAFMRSSNKANFFGSAISSSKLVWAGGKTLEGRFNWKFGLRSDFVVDSTRLDQSIPTQPSSLLASFMAMLPNSFGANKSTSSDFVLFPNTSFHAIKGTKWLYSLNLFPDSEHRTSIRYDLLGWQSEAVVDSYAERISGLLCEQLEERVRYLESEFDRLLQNPEQSTSDLPGIDSIYRDADSKTQSTILDHLQAHTKLEKIQGMEISPAMRQPRVTQKFLQADMC